MWFGVVWAIVSGEMAPRRRCIIKEGPIWAKILCESPIDMGVDMSTWLPCIPVWHPARRPAAGPLHLGTSTGNSM